MNIITDYGNIDYDDLVTFDLSDATIDYIKKRKSASELFFSNEIDITDETEFSDELSEINNVVLLDSKFSNPERAMAISEHTGVEVIYIDENDDEYTVQSSSTYLVLTDEEADTRAIDSATELLEDIGITHLDISIIREFTHVTWFNDYMKENNESYAFDIMQETSSDNVYINRLHEEMVSAGILDEPEWPDEDDYMTREEFDEPEPHVNDFDTTDEYQKEFDNWEKQKSDWDEKQDEIEQTNMNKYEEAKDEYSDQLEKIVENSIDDFVEHLNSNYEDGLEYFIENFGAEEAMETIKKYDLVSFDKLAEHIISQDGRGPSISSYDGSEESVSVTYKGEEYDFFIYRMN